MKRLIQLKVNDEIYEVAVHPHRTLLEVLREELDLTGTKRACNVGDCGSCTVILEGKPVVSCLTLAVEADGKDKTGLSPGDPFEPGFFLCFHGVKQNLGGPTRKVEIRQFFSLSRKRVSTNGFFCHSRMRRKSSPP